MPPNPEPTRKVGLREGAAMERGREGELRQFPFPPLGRRRGQSQCMAQGQSDMSRI